MRRRGARGRQHWGWPTRDDLGRSVAAVHDRDGHVVGAAFLIEADTLVTCAHVVTRALRLPADAPAPQSLLSVTFPLVGHETISAAVIEAHWQPPRADDSGDVATLRLIQRPPSGSHPVRLADSDRLWGHPCRAFGFPDGHDSGRWFSGKLRNEVGGGWVQIVAESSHGHAIKPGFSGAPVWDDQTHRVVGMTVAYDTDPTLRTAFMIPGRMLRPLMRPVRRSWAGAARGATVVLAVLTLVGLAAGPDPAAVRPPTCAQPVGLRIAVSASGLPSYRAVADAYERWTAERNGGCRTADLYVYPVTPAAVAPASEGSSPTDGRAELGDSGLHPDVLLPGTLATPEELLGSAARPHVVDIKEIASSPLVLAVAESRVQPARDDRDRVGRLSWHRLFLEATRAVGARGDSAPEGRGWGMVRPDPTRSLVGRLVTTALYAGVGAERDNPSRIRQEIERWIERAQDAGGYPPGDETVLLCRQREMPRSGATAAAVVTTEQSVVEFNLGGPIGSGCAARASSSGNGQRMVAFYPADTPPVKHHFVRLMWDDVVQSDAARQTAQDLGTWLADQEAGRAALVAAGLRVEGRNVDAPLTEANGVLPDWPFGHLRASAPAAEVQHRALQTYLAAHRPGRVLVAVDASGSMLTAAGDGRRTRFEAALDTVQASLARMGGNDEFGLWLFSSSVSDAGWRQAVPISRRGRAQDAALRGVRSRVTPAGDTPLYRTIDAGIRAVRGATATGADPLRALVVLTDGEDTASGAFVPEIGGGVRARVFVVAIGEASCAVPVIERVTEGSGGECFNADANTIDATLSTLFRVLWQRGD